jgi:IS605 OrfB family transposase
MPAIDIRKHASGRSVHYEPLGRKVYTTDIARLRNITSAGRAFLGGSAEFCRMERTLIARLLSGKPISKPEIMRQFAFPGRMFNAALDSGEGMIDSAKACAQLALAGTREAIARALVHYEEAELDPSRQGELPGRRRRLEKLIAQESRHEKNVVRPRLFPGADLFRTQHKDKGWITAFRARRSDHIGSSGGADEAFGNTTLQVSLGPVEVISGRLWQGFVLSHSRKQLCTFRLWVAECEGLVQAVLANTPSPAVQPVEVWFDAVGKKIGPMVQRRMIANGVTPTAVRTIQRTVTTGRVGFTIELRRRADGRWYLHLSREEKGLAVERAPVGWMGVDLNCDSIAHAVVSFRDETPAAGPAGERRTALYRIIDRLVDEAAQRNVGISLEYLDFEHCKRWLKSKLGALLHVMPYRRILGIFERRCLELGVPLRYVPPKYSSLLGALLSARWPQLGRDQAAGAVLALRASEVGNPWLEGACEQAAKAQQISLRLNAKGRYGHTLVVEAERRFPTSKENAGRQMDSPRYPVEPALQWQVVCGRKVRDAFATLAALRADLLREQRRAAKAQKCIQPACSLHLQMPQRIKLGSAERFYVPSDSSSITVA